MKLLKKHKWTLLGVIIVFFVSLLFPFSGDDWEWSLVQIDSNILSNFANRSNLNGRYFGNLIVSIITKNIVIRGIFISIFLNLIVIFIKKETKCSLILIWLLLLTMPINMFNQTISWVSGFTNYVISTFFLLLTLCLIRKIYNYGSSILYTISTCIIVFLTSLFVENLTIFILMLLIATLLMKLVKNRIIDKHLLLILFSSLLGNIVMFSHPAYLSVLNGVDQYRTISSNILNIPNQMFENYAFSIQKYMILQNIVVISCITILLYLHFKKSKDKEYRKIIEYMFIYNFMYVVYATISYISKFEILGEIITVYFDGILTGIFIINVIFITYIIFHNKNNFYKIFAPLIVIFGLILPLLIVTPLGPRNFFMIYVLEMIFILYLFKELKIKNEVFIKNISFAFLSVLLVFYIGIYSQVNRFFKMRENYILEESKNSKLEYILVPKNPYSKYVWSGDFDNEYYTNIYKNYLNIDSRVDFRFIEYIEWKRIIEKDYK